jgi:hypothetical protein
VLAKKTVKNQITLPKAIVAQLPAVDYFEVSLRGQEIVLSPVVPTVPGQRLREVRARMRALGLTEKSVEEAVRWARRRRG